MTSAKVLLDSVSECGCRLTTMEVCFPRWLLAQFNTHRMFSRNAASSRAIPVRKLWQRVWRNPSFPAYWGSSRKGMVAGAELSGWRLRACKLVWLVNLCVAGGSALVLNWLGLHKQHANRLLEPFAHVTVLVTATDWENFFSLRCADDAQPEMRELAQHMLRAYLSSTPQQLKVGQWHLPYADRFAEGLTLQEKLAVSVARCARVSYLNHEGETSPAKDFSLHDTLLKESHNSPLEHQARALAEPTRIGNLLGWQQYRKTIPNENRKVEDLHTLLRSPL